MLKEEYNVIGVMSGTSMDGLDLVFMSLKKNAHWEYKVHCAETLIYSAHWDKKLKNLIHLNINDLKVIDVEYTQYLSEKINYFIKKNKIKNIDAICSHGHTALHQPSQKLTYQIGNLPELASLVNNIIVCDFRVQDVELGGQGAPLVPIGDQLLFSNYDYCVNLGGFANISFEKENTRLAYDICPVNIVLNHYVKNLGFNYDDKGKISSKGTINIDLLKKLNSIDFYNLKHPKSLGLEWVKTEIIPLIDSFQLETKGILRTFIEHIAIQITKEIDSQNNKSILITGGGAYNVFLIDRLQNLTKANVVIPEKTIVEYKEAIIFGFLGVLKLRNEINCLSSVTGSYKDHSSGKIYKP